MANVSAEKVFLAGVIRHPDKFFDFVEYLDEDDFKHSATKMTFEAIRSLYVNKEAQKITKSKLVAEAKALGHSNYLSATKNGEWIDELLAEEVSEHEVDSHYIEVKRQSLKEDYKDVFSDMRDYVSTTTDPLSIMIGTVEDAVTSKVQNLDKGEHAIVDMREGFREFLEELAENPGQMGLDIGYPIWQERCGQIRNGTITFLVGTTGSGKSQFGMRAAVSAARKGLPVLYLDSELNQQDQWIRIAAMVAKVPSDIVESGFWKLSETELRSEGVSDNQDVANILACGRRLRDPRLWEIIDKMPIYYQSITGLDVSEVIPHMRRWLLTHVKPDRETRTSQCLMVYDYIKLVLTNEIRSGKLQEWQQHGLNVSHLHDFTKKYNIPMIAFGQTNNELDSLGIKCVAGGKRISENVGSVSYFKRKSDAELAQDGNGTHMMRLFKARYGKGLWEGYINFDADLSQGHFIELDIGSVQANNNNTNDDDDDDGE